MENKKSTLAHQLVCLIFGIFWLLPTIYGSLLLLSQVTVWASDGVWIALPVRYVFMAPGLTENREELPQEILARNNDQSGLTFDSASVEIGLREAVKSKDLRDFVPFIPKLYIADNQINWLANPKSFYGIHRVVYWVLDLFSLPIVVLAIAWLFHGIFVVIEQTD